MRLAMGSLLMLLAAACATPAPVSAPGAPPAWASLSRFSGEEDFRAYVRAVRAAAQQARAPSHTKQQAPDACPPELYPCVDETPSNGDEAILVTGSRITAASAEAPTATVSVEGEASITNVQNIGVDEGGIVKLYGRFLIVLQDGRLFSIDTGAGADELALADRINVYRHAGAGVWYDEILIHANRVIATGYNYDEDATEFSVFSINDEGRFTREGVYFLSSDDYYDSENYATRLVGDNLVIYTPLAVADIELERASRWPLVRRWLYDQADEARTTPGRPLFGARDIYRPLQAVFSPVVHTISVCPLGSPAAGDELECRNTGFVAPAGAEFYVSTSHVYLWTWASYDHDLPGIYDAACAVAPESFAAAAPGALLQIPLRGGAPRAQFIRGMPYDQLSMDAAEGEFRALSVWLDRRCDDVREEEATLRLRYVSTPLGDFSATPAPIPEARYTPLPSVGPALENRFTATHLVYGGREDWYSRAPEPGSQTTMTSRVVAVPTAAPGAYVELEAAHGALRVERVGRNVIVAGYGDWRGLSLSLVDLAAAPRIASTVLLEEHYESEGRSHAFNAMVGADGAGLMGLATVMRRAESGRWWWRSAGSDVSYIAVDAAGQLADAGFLRGTSPRHPSYRCEVSCIDWYGNTRALFIGRRVFALSGTELIEGAMEEGIIAERARLNLTTPPPRRAKGVSADARQAARAGLARFSQ